jgi:hypothetical protein
LQNAIEKRCIICCWFLVRQLLAAWRRSMSKLGCPAAFNCPAAIGARPRFANSGYVSLGRSQSVQQPGEPWRFIATAYSQRFAASGARSPHVSAARHPCLSTNDDGRRSTANSDRQTFAATGHQKRFSANGDRRRSTANNDRQRFAATGHQKRFSTNDDRRRSTANSDRQRFSTIGSRQELATACQ